MANDPIVITPSNSPYAVPGGSVNYGQVKIKGGWMQLLFQTVLTIDSVEIQSTPHARTAVLELKKG